MYFKKPAWIVILLSALFLGGVGNAFGGSAILNWTANEESDLNEYRVYFGESSRNYGPYIPVPSGTQYTVEGLEAGKTYYFAVTAVDTSGNESGFSQEVSKTVAAAVDTVAPDIQILQPTDAEFFITQSATISLAGSASDNVGVTAVSWSTDTGESGQATGTNAWEISDLSLSAEQTTITVAALDEAGNRAESSILISYADSRSAFSVSQVQAASGKSYTVHSGLKDGETSYIDRSYSYSQVPAELQGSHYIRTANNDKGAKGSDFLRFMISADATVYIAHDDRITTKPAWMAGFSDTGMDLLTAAKPMSIYQKTFSAGEVVLGGNADSPFNSNMYAVAIRGGATDATDSTDSSGSDASGNTDDSTTDQTDTSSGSDAGDSTDPVADDSFAMAVSNVEAASGKDYITVTGLRDGETSYLDRSYAYSEVPAELAGSIYIRTANDDKSATGEDFLRFTVSADAVVYVAHDDRISDKPSWMAGFSDTGMDLKSADTPMSLFRKSFPAGEVILGGNVVSSGNSSMYTVAIRGVASTDTSGTTESAESEDETNTSDSSEGTTTDSSTETGDSGSTDSGTETGTLTISGIEAASGETYLAADGLKDGEKSYIDRDYSYQEVPDSLVGGVYIRTANDDKMSDGDDFLRFSISQDATVYVAHDDRISTKPSWMLGFTDTGENIFPAAKQMSLFRKSFSAGEVILGGNGDRSGGTSNYTVIVVAE